MRSVSRPSIDSSLPVPDERHRPGVQPRQEQMSPLAGTGRKTVVPDALDDDVEIVEMVGAGLTALRGHLDPLSASVRVEHACLERGFDGPPIVPVKRVPPCHHRAHRAVPPERRGAARQDVQAPRIAPQVLNPMSLQNAERRVEMPIAQIEGRDIVTAEEQILEPAIEAAMQRHAGLHLRVAQPPAGPLEREHETGPVPPGSFGVFENHHVRAGGAGGSCFVGPLCGAARHPPRVSAPQDRLRRHREPGQIRGSPDLAGPDSRPIHEIVVERNLPVRRLDQGSKRAIPLDDHAFRFPPLGPL